MNKKLIRLTESDLHRIVKQSVKRILREMDEGKVVNNKSYFRNLDDSGVAEKGDSVWKYTNRDKSPEELEKHNKRAKNYKMNNDPLALRKHQLDSMDFDGPNTIQGKLRRKKDDEALMDDFYTNRW